MMRCFIFAAVAALAMGQTAKAWPEADRIFHSDPQWLGSDGAFSIDLGGGRVLWLFGDTLIGRKPGDTRKNATFVRNTVAIMNGYDPTTAQMKFYWRKGTWLGSRMEIFPNEGKIWFWPAQGIRVGNRLVIFCSRVAPNPDKKSLGFQAAGWVAYSIANPEAAPTEWKMRKVMEEHGELTLGLAAIREGEFVYVFGWGDPQQNLYLARWRVADFEAGNFEKKEWWCGTGFEQSEADRKPVMLQVSTEIGVQRDPRGGFIEVNSQGFGGSDIVMRRAARLEGPWSAARKIYRPPESDGKDPFVYAGKLHGELKGGDVVVTYAVNGKDAEVSTNPEVYYPRFVRMNWENR